MDTNCNCSSKEDLPLKSEKEIRKEKELAFLDTLDIEAYLKVPNISVNHIMSEIDEDHAAKYKDETSIFNCLTADDFIQYIKTRYKGKYSFYLYTDIRIK